MTVSLNRPFIRCARILLTIPAGQQRGNWNFARPCGFFIRLLLFERGTISIISENCSQFSSPILNFKETFFSNTISFFGWSHYMPFNLMPPPLAKLLAKRFSGWDPHRTAVWRGPFYVYPSTAAHPYMQLCLVIRDEQSFQMFGLAGSRNFEEKFGPNPNIPSSPKTHV